MQEDNKCIHCGADCGKNPVVWNGMKFCCNGCKTVYQILNENKLYKYYNIDDAPGIRVDAANTGNKYAYLDKEDIQEKIFEFQEGDTVKVNFFIPVIHCASCIWLLENLRTLHKGINHSIANFVRKEVSITFDKSEISLRQLVELLVSIHYIPEISVDDKSEKEKESKANKKLLYKMGIAGFVFMNVMTYSLPEYFGLKLEEDNIASLFRILSYILVIPVVFYSASDYFISAFKNLIKKNINIDLPIALGVSVLFIVTSYEIISGTGSGYCDSLAGLIFFLLLGKNIQSRTYQALSFDRDYKSYFPIAVTKFEDGVEKSILLSEIEIEDEILIRNKELIPADSILVEGNGLIDYSFVTGESVPVVKNTGDFIYAGGRQTGGIIKVKIEKEVEQSHLTKLWNQSGTNDDEEKSLKSITDKVSEYFTLIVIGIALIGFAGWLIAGNFTVAIFVFTAVLIVACPCALALSLPFTFGNTMRLFGKAGLYIKNISVIEQLTKIDSIVFDKTGTITKPDENNIEFHGESLSDVERMAVKSIAKQSTHPLSNAIFQHLEVFDYLMPEHFVEMSGKGVFGKVGNIEIRLGSKDFVDAQNIKKSSDNYQKASTVYIALNDSVKGYFSVSNKYREGFEDVIQSLANNFDLYLLSGDNDRERERLSQYFDKNKILFNQKPQDKKDFIEELQKNGKNILMTGDGLNDAGALMQSDVALSVADDVYHFSPAGDAVLEAQKFKQLSKFINFTKTSLNIVKVSFIISFLYNIIGIGFALSGTLSPVIAAILMPISSISVVAFATFATRIAGRKL
ncbi:MAG: heavy metal translocating P-type ATPase metal-binding domain-containing protein [Bacteroidota bacterium]|nr:heavy metal translocating P-type ATPase metal-binding domain-containing protein [Bacteroidota bacterium]